MAIACFRLLQYAIFMAVAWLLRVFDYYSMQSSWLLRAERGTKLFHAHSLLRFTTLSVIAVWRFMHLCLSLFACTKITIANSSTSGPWKVPFKKCEAPEKALLNKSILVELSISSHSTDKADKPTSKQVERKQTTSKQVERKRPPTCKSKDSARLRASRTKAEKVATTTQQPFNSHSIASQ